MIESPDLTQRSMSTTSISSASHQKIGAKHPWKMKPRYRNPVLAGVPHPLKVMTISGPPQPPKEKTSKTQKRTSHLKGSEMLINPRYCKAPGCWRPTT